MRIRASSAVLAAAALYGALDSGRISASTWTVPGTVNAGGLNGTRFVSDLAVTNPGSVPLLATIAFIPANGTTPRQVTLTPGQTVVYRNVLDSLWGAQGAGATRVAADSPLLVRARTYNTAPSGTYGVALPVFADDRLLGIGKTAHSLWLSQSADGRSGYRTNVAVVFPDDGGGSATVTVFDASGAEIGSQAYRLDAAGFQQFSVASFAGAVPVSRAELVVTRGRGAGYSVVVDNVTGDSSLFTFEELPTGYQDVVANGVARANGRNGTFFRTDGRFFNPASEDALVRISFHASGPANPSPTSRTFTVGAGRILDIVDVLGSLLDLPVGSAGAVRFETDAPVAILCRTSNVDPSGVKPGTFGAQQRPTPLLSFVMSADAGAVVTGIRQNAAFRTNVGFAAGAEGADYALTLRNAAGATVATSSGSLGAFGWTQPNVQDLFPATAIPDDATLQVNVTAGSVDVFDSSIDNASGDPVVTPIMPLPLDVPSSATIGPRGGSVRSADGRLTLKVPAGALSAPVSVGLTATTVADADAFGSAYVLTPSPLPLAKPALLVFRAGDPAPSLGLGSITLAVRTDAGTFAATGGRVDPAAATLTVPIASTAPSAASAVSHGGAARGALVIGTIVVPVTNLELDRQYAAVLTDGSATFRVVFRWPPSAGGETAGYKLELDRTGVAWAWSKPKLGKTVVNPGEMLYTAPHRIPISEVFDELTLTVQANPHFKMIFFVSVEIVRRDWIIESDFTLNHVPCEQEVFPYELDWHNFQTGTFRINDGGSITLTGSQYQYENPQWKLCPAPAVAQACTCKWYDKLIPDPNGFFDLETELTAFSKYDFTRAEFDLEGNSNYASPGAWLRGGTFPYDDQRIEPVTFPLPISFRARVYQEDVWFTDDNASYGPYFTSRRRIRSVDTP